MIDVLQLCQRATRNLAIRDVSAMELDDQQTVLDCVNAGAMALHNSMAPHHKRGGLGAQLVAPITAATAAAIPDQCAGRSVVLTGDGVLNRFRNDAKTSGTIGGDLFFPKASGAGYPMTIYGDVVRLSYRIKTAFDLRIVGDTTSLAPWNSLDIPPVAATGHPRYYRIDSVLPEARAENEAVGIYTLRDVASYIRVWPLPDVLYRLTYQVQYGPFVVVLSDIITDAETTPGAVATPRSVPILDSYHSDLISFIEEELAGHEFYVGDKKAAVARAERSRARLLEESTRVDVGNHNTHGTPRNW